MANDRTAQQTAIAVYKAILAGPKTARELADLCGLSLRGLYHVMDNISLEDSLTNYRGHWYMLTTDEQRDADRLLAHLTQEIACSQKASGALIHPLSVSDAIRLVNLLRRLVPAPEPK